MQVGFREDMLKQRKQQKSVEAEIVKQSKADEKRDLIMTYYFMRVKQSAIAKSVGVSRQYVSKYKQDYIILSYILPGQLTASHIANILGIEEITVVDVIQRYQNFITSNAH